MLWWSLIFFLIAVITAVFGFGGIAAGAVTVARILFAFFMIVFLISLVIGLTRHRI